MTRVRCPRHRLTLSGRGSIARCGYANQQYRLSHAIAQEGRCTEAREDLPSLNGDSKTLCGLPHARSCRSRAAAPAGRAGKASWRCRPALIGPVRDGPGRTLVPRQSCPRAAGTRSPRVSTDLRADAYPRPCATAIRALRPSICPATFPPGARPQDGGRGTRCAEARLRPAASAKYVQPCNSQGASRVSNFHHVIARLSRH
jgi:hypothetical protein